jgi:hypothetical protein
MGARNLAKWSGRTHRPRWTFEALETRLYLSEFYDFDVIAQTNSELSSFTQFPSINDSGQVAFIANLASGGEGIFVGTGNNVPPTQLSGPGSANTTYLASVQINNAGQVLASQRNFTPNFRSLNVWDANSPGTFTRLAGSGVVGSSVFSFASIDPNDDQVVFAAIDQQGANVSFRRPTSPNSMGSLLLDLPNGPQPSLRPMASDGGRFVVRVGNDSSDSIVLLSSAGVATDIATSANFSALGSAPGVSDDGQIVTFYGNLNATGAARFGTTPGPGIFASIQTSSGRIVQRIAGLADGQFLDPGETFVDGNNNGRFDTGEQDIGPFTSLVGDARVGVNSTQNDQRAVTIAYMGTDSEDHTGIYTSRLNFFPRGNTLFNSNNPGQFTVSPATLVVEQGEAIPGLIGNVQNVNIFDPINNRDRGDVAFWVGMDDSEQAIVRGRPHEVIFLDFDPAANFQLEPLTRFFFKHLGVAPGFAGDMAEVFSSLAPNRTDLNGAVTSIQNNIVNFVQAAFDDMDANTPGNQSVNVRIWGRVGESVPTDGPVMHVYIGDGPHKLTNPSSVAGIAPGDIFNQNKAIDRASGQFLYVKETPLIFVDNIFRGGFFTDPAGNFVSLGQASGPGVITRDQVELAIASTVLHEIGHALGLRHVVGNLNELIMNQTIDLGEPFVDNNYNGVFDAGDSFTDRNGNGVFDPVGVDELRFLQTFGNVSSQLPFSEGFHVGDSENASSRLAFAVGSNLDLTVLPRDPPSPSVIANDQGFEVSLRTDVGRGLINVERAVLGIIEGGNEHSMPDLVDLGSGDLAMLLDRHIDARIGDQMFLVASTNGSGIDILSTTAGLTGDISAIDLTNWLMVATDEAVRGAMFDSSGQGSDIALELYQTTPTGQVKIGVVGVDHVASQSVVAADDTAFTDQNRAVSIAALANDRAGDGMLDLGTLAIVTGPDNGTAAVRTANCTAEQTSGVCYARIDYQPKGGFIGTDTFTYQISNSGGATATAMVTVTVQAPVPAQPPGLFSGAVNYKVGGYPNLPGVVEIGDFNGDRTPDLVTMSSSGFSVFPVRGDGTFQAPIFTSIPAGVPTAMAPGDYNGDGKFDLLVGFITEQFPTNIFSVQLLLGQGDGTFQPTGAILVAAANPFAAVAKDLNGDGKLDAVVLSTGPDLFRNDISVSVFLGNGNGTFRPTMTFSTHRTLHSIIVHDFNRDGKPDLAASADNRSGNGAVVLWLGKGDGTFQQAVEYPLIHPLLGLGSYGVNSLASGDFNGDGKPDLAASTQFSDGASGEFTAHNTVNVLFSNGDGTFQPAVDYVDFPPVGDRSSPDSFPLVAGDFDGDGKTDLATGALASHDVSVMISRAAGAPPVARRHGIGTGSLAMVAGDLNGDGRTDLVSANENDTVSVLLANADGRFSRSVQIEHGLGEYEGLAPIYPTLVIPADVNGDAKPDVVVGGSNVFTALLNNGDGTFQAPIRFDSPAFQGNVAVGDFNGDRLADLAVAYVGVSQCLSCPDAPFTGGSITIMQGSGDGRFSPMVQYAASNEGPFAILADDFNNDGRWDLATTSYNEGEVNIRLGNGDGTFRMPLPFDAGVSLRDLASADFDQDGNLDLVTADFGAVGIPGGLTVLLGNGNGTFRSVFLATSCGTGTVRHQTVAAGDFNGDGLPDLGTDEFFQLQGESVRLNVGNGTFREPVCFPGEPALDLQTADFNGDNATDLLVVSGGIGTGVLLGNGDGSLRNPIYYATDPFAQSVALADFNGDGNPDLVMASGAYYLDFLTKPVPITTLPGIRVSPTSGLRTTEAGGTAEFTVVLTTIPADDVVIMLRSSDATEGSVSPGSLTFTPANALVLQTVTITGADDGDRDGDIGYTIVLTVTSNAEGYDGIDASDVTVRNIDNEGNEGGVNQPPVLDAIGTKSAVIGRLLSFTARATDDLPNALTFSLDPGAPPDAVIDPGSGLFSWTPPFGQAIGATFVTIRVTDGGFLSDSEQIEIDVQRPAPPVVRDLDPIVTSSKISGARITFSQAMNVLRAQDMNNYTLASAAGKDKRFGTRDDKKITLRSANYDPLTHQVVLTPKKPLAATKPFALIVNDTPGLTSESGESFDGDGDGVPGGRFMLLVGSRISFTDSDRDAVVLTLSGGGVMALTIGPSGDGNDLKIYFPSPGRSVLTGSVKKSKRPPIGTGMTHLRSISGISGVSNRLPGTIQVESIAAAVIDRLLERETLVFIE